MKKILLLFSSCFILWSAVVSAQNIQSSLNQEEIGVVAITHSKYGKDFYVSYDYETNTIDIVSKKDITGLIEDSVKNFSEELSKGAKDVYTIKLYNVSDLEKNVAEFTTTPTQSTANQLSGQTNNASYVIKNMYVTDNSMFPGKKVLVLDMQFTNNQQQPASPWTTFILDYAAQINNGATTIDLMGANGQMGNVENQEAVAMGDTNVNPGSTVNAIIGYDYSDPSAVVNFILRTSLMSGTPQGFTFNP